MAIDPVKIPQNVYVEDRIIGPITLKQIMIVMASSGLSYTIWAIMRQSGMSSGANTLFAWIPTVIGTAFAFVKINGISLFRIMLLLIERIDKPARRVWTPRKGIYVNIATAKKDPSKKDKETDKKQIQKTQQEGEIEELSRLLDQGPPEEAEESVAEAEAKAMRQADTPSKPVKRERIQADKRKKPVDDIRQTPKDTPPSPGGLMRDISPPSHA